MKNIKAKIRDIFVEYVSTNRNIPIEEVKSIATGEPFLAEDAAKTRTYRLYRGNARSRSMATGADWG